MPDQHHPDHQPNPDDLFAGSFPPPAAGGTAAGDPFEQLLRTRLHQLAEHAPTTVHSLDELRVEHGERIGNRAERRREGRHRRTAGIGATIAALAGAIGFTTVALTGAGTAGAASPEEAVRSFLDAAQAEDVFGMIDALDPEEVPSARAAAERGRGDAVAADVVSDGFQLDGIDGVDLAFSDLAFTTESVVEGVAVVEATGGVSFRFDPAAFPIGGALAEALASDLEVIDEQARLDEIASPAMLATVERDGRWFVSASFTAGEYARRSADLPMPTAPLVAVGAPTPEAAVDEFWSNVVSLDLAGALSQAVPGEGDAVLAYGPLLVEQAAETIASAKADGYGLTFGGGTYEVTGSDDRRRLTPTSFSVSGTVADTTAYLYFDPSLPTVVTTWEGNGVVVLEPGVPVPATLEGLTIDTTYTYPEGPANYTYENEDGTVAPLPEMPEDFGPQELTIAREGDCTTYSGPGAMALLGGSSTTTNLDGELVTEIVEPPTDYYEKVGDESWRTCEDAGGVWGLLGALTGNISDLPAIDVVERGGQWYVSPVGSVAGAILDVVGLSDDGDLFDSQFAYYVLGSDRTNTELMLQGTRASDLTEECRAIVELDADGVVAGVVDDPDLAAVRACVTGSVFTDQYYETPVPMEDLPPGGVIEEAQPVPADPPQGVIEVEVAPASTVP